MGSYNSEYESYYAKIMGKKRGPDSYRKDYSVGNLTGTQSKNVGDIIIKRVIQELAGAFILFMLIFMFKMIKTPETITAYAMAKDIVSKGYSVEDTINYAKTMDLSSIKSSAEVYVEDIKEKLGAGDSIKERSKENFIKPLLGEYKVYDEKQKIYSVSVSEATDVNSVYDGKVKKVGEDETLGKYMIIDNGSGIETVYGGLAELALKEDQDVAKGEMIGKVSSSFLFQLKYMGEGRNIEDYMNMD